MTSLEATMNWLAKRLADAPPELAADVRALVHGVAGDETDQSGEGVPTLLVRASLAGLEEVIDGLGRRDSALRLLSADAALTFAFEAMADLGGDVEELCQRLGPGGEFGRRLAGASSTGDDA